MAHDPRVDAVTFTGSTRVGEAIHRQVGPDRRAQLEMGGKNPVVVAEDADLDRAAALIAKGAFGLSGQACTGTSRVIAWTRSTTSWSSGWPRRPALRVGPGPSPGSTWGRWPAPRSREVPGYVRVGVEEGATLRRGGTTVGDRGFFVRPAVFSDTRPTMRIVREEVFGPLLAFLRVGSFDEAVALANATEFGLCAAIVTHDLAAAAYVRAQREERPGQDQPTDDRPGDERPVRWLQGVSTQTFKEQAGESMMEFYTLDKTVYLNPVL